jgi:hypothetical protein
MNNPHSPKAQEGLNARTGSDAEFHRDAWATDEESAAKDLQRITLDAMASLGRRADMIAEEDRIDAIKAYRKLAEAFSGTESAAQWLAEAERLERETT